MPFFQLSVDVAGALRRLVPFAPLQNVKLQGLKDDVKALELRLRKLKVWLHFRVNFRSIFRFNDRL